VSEIVTVPFHGDDILTLDVDGTPYVILKPVLEGLGLDYWSQVEKLRKRSWAAPSNRQVQLPGDTQRRSHLVVDLRTFLMLLATLDENRVGTDVRDKLVTYQAEVADVIERYYTEGAAINPRASEEQLDRVIDLTQRRLALLQAASGLVDPAWLEAKTRHEIARGLGEEPELDAGTRPLTVGEYLTDKGMSGAPLRSMSTVFGKKVKKAFRDRYDAEPPKVERFVDGALRQVAGYTEQHRHLFDTVWAELIADEEGAA
jgi:hypothetical protein